MTDDSGHTVHATKACAAKPGTRCGGLVHPRRLEVQAGHRLWDVRMEAIA